MSEASEAEAQRWFAVPVPLPATGSTTPFEVEGQALLLCNAEGTLYVVDNECPHQRVPLTGAVVRGTVLECPLHGGKLDVRDGSAQGLPIRKAAPCYALRSGPDGGWQVALPGRG